MGPSQAIGNIGIGFSINMGDAIGIPNDFYIRGINLCKNSRGEEEEEIANAIHIFLFIEMFYQPMPWTLGDERWYGFNV